MKRVLALMLALMLAIPGIAFSEDASAGEIAVSDAAELEDAAIDGLSINGADLGGFGDIDLGDLLDDGLDAGLVSNAPESPVPVAFEQTATVGEAVFTVTANAGAFPAEARLSVEAVDAGVAQAAAQSIESTAQGTHHLYAISVLDGNGNALRPANDVELPLARVDGLDLDGEARVFVYDRELNGSYEIGTEGSVQFRFQESAIYDIVDVKQAGQPVDEEPQPLQPVEEVQLPGQPAEEEQSEQELELPGEEAQPAQELELPAGATQEEDAAEPFVFSELEALNDLAYEIDVSNVDDDPEATAANGKNDAPVTEDERVKALEKLPTGNKGFSLDKGAYIDANGSARKIVLTKMAASLKNPITGEAIDTFEVPMKNSYIKVEDDVILIQASRKGLREGDTLSLGDCRGVYEGNNALKAGAILLILDAGKNIHAYYAASVTDTGLTLGREINALRGIETCKLNATWSFDFGPVGFSWGDHAQNYIDITHGVLALNFDVDAGFVGPEGYPYLDLNDISFETTVDEIDVHLDEWLDVGTAFDILTWSIDYDELIGVEQGIKYFIDGQGQGDTVFNFHSKYGFYADMYYDMDGWPWEWHLEVKDSGWIKDDPTFGLSKCDMQGEFFMGPEYDYSITALADVFGIGFPVKNGIHLDGELWENHEYPGDSDRKYWHECEECTAGTGCGRVGELNVEASLIGDTYTIVIAHADGYDFDEFDYYDSKTFDDRDLTACPHKGYRLNVTVDDTAGTSTEGTAVSYAPAPQHYEGATSKTADKDGKAVLYAPAGASIDVTATMTSPHDTSWTISQTQTITKQAKTEELKLTIEIPVKHVQFKNAQSGKAKQMPDDLDFAPFLEENVALPDNVPELSGFQFTGWNTKKDGSGKRYAPGSTITSRDDVTLWAQWAKAEDSWFVVYNANGGTKAPKTQIVKRGKDATLSKEHAKAGKMIFKGWTTNPKKPKVEYKPGDVLPYDSEKNVVVLYAVWNLSPVPQPVHVTFDANGLAKADLPEDVWLEQGGWLQLSAAIAPLGSAYVFRGWSEKRGSKEPEFQAGKSYRFDHDVKLYAIWKKQKMTTLTFKDSLPGGASDIPNPITIVPSMSSNVQIPSAIPRKGGRQFTGWNTKKDGSGKRYAPGSTITLKADRTLWAQWVKAEDSWFVIYDANGGTKAPKPQIVKQGKDATLSKEHAKAGKMIFKGWTTNPKVPKVEYKPGDVLPYDSEKNVVVLYAVWNLSPVPQPVHVTFDANGLASADLPEDVWLEQGGWLQLSAAIAPLGSAYVFRGWSEKSSSKEPEFQAGKSYRFDHDVKLYAIWKKQKMTTLTFKDSLPGGASDIPNPITIVPSMSSNVQIPSAIPQKGGRQFTGWNTKKDGSGSRYAPGSTITLKADRTLWAQWVKAEDSWFVIYDANGGTKAPKPQIVKQGKDATLSKEHAKAGKMIFKGWTTNPKAPKVEYKPGDVLPYDSQKNVVVLYAVWNLSPVPRPVHVTFDANGLASADVPEDVWLEQGGWLQLSAAFAPLGSGYSFLGWSEKSSSKEPEYLAGRSYRFDHDVKLYAVWNLSPVPRPVHVTFDANGLASADLPEDVWLEQGGWLQLSAAFAPLGSGYSFLGWSEKSNSKEPEYLAGRSYPFDRNTKLYAVWKKVVAPDYTLLARMTVSHCDSKALEIVWTKVQSVEGYDVFFARCGSNFKLKQTVSANTRHLRVSSLDKRTCYKAYVKAWKTVNGKKVYIGKASPEVHAITGGYNSKYCNARSVKLDKSSLTMEAGNSKTLKATVKKVKSNKELLNHTAKVRYYSSDPNVAAVDENGKITAVEAGKCRIWAIATNGVRASVSVTVK